MKESTEIKPVRDILEKYSEKITDDLLSSVRVNLSLGEIINLYSILIFNDRIVDKTLSIVLETLSKDKATYNNIEILLEEQKQRIENFFIKILDDAIGDL